MTDKISELAVPKYEHIKHVYGVFDERVHSIEANKYLLTIPTHQKYFYKMKKIRERVQNVIKSHKLYNELDFKKLRNSDPLYGEIPEGTLKALDKLSKPLQRHLRATLMKINQIIREIKSDHHYKENPLKMKRIKELLEYRENICCLIAKDLKKDQKQCHRFASCEPKIIDIWEIPREGRPNSRYLKFDFDEGTTKLAFPKYVALEHTKQSLKDLLLKYLEQKSKLSDLDQKKCQFDALIEKLNQKLMDVEKLEEKMMELGKTCKRKSVCDLESKSNFDKFTNPCFELPLRRRVKEVLNVYNTCLCELEKKQQFLKEKAPPVHSCIKPFKDRVKRNISFVKKLLETLPEDKNCECICDDPKGCNVKKPLSIVYDENGHVQYIFDEKTNKMAFPKLHLMDNALQCLERVLEIFERDLKNVDAIQDGRHEIIQNRIKRLKDLIAEKNQLIERQKNNQTEPGEPKTYLHLKSCAQKEFIKFWPVKYKGLKERKPVSTSAAHAKFLIDSFASYARWISERENDIRYRDKIQKILLEKTSVCGYENQEEDEEPEEFIQSESKEINRCHIQRMVENKLKLENLLKTLCLCVEDAHFQSHQKFEESPKLDKMPKGKFDVKRLKDLALPKKVCLKHTLVSYSHFMSETKRSRIQCRYTGSHLKPEQMEQILSSPKLFKEKRLRKVVSRNEQAAMCHIFDKIIKNNIDELIRFSVLHALMI